MMATYSGMSYQENPCMFARMECSLYCQVCRANFSKVFAFMSHLRSNEHEQKMKDIFPKATLQSSGVLPYIVFMNGKAKRGNNKPVLGLSLMTFCFSLARAASFYLCHVCERSCSSDNILRHIFSMEHYSNYISYTNPNELKFSWMPSMDMRKNLGRMVIKHKSSPPKLQMLNIPINVFEELNSRTCSEVMRTLCESEHLLKLFEDIQPKRMTIQAYQNDSNRKHPLLGMQHLVECVCVERAENRSYLCTLCSLTVASHMIIKHVLSFDHIYCYFKAWHPSTLMSKESYQYKGSFVRMMIDLANQTEEIHGTTSASMKTVNLEPNEFKSVNFTCYAEALRKLESITKSSLTASIEPGNRLEYGAAVARPKSPPKKLKLRCQDCNETFNCIVHYMRHLNQWKHEKMLRKFFDGVGRGNAYGQRVGTYLDLYTYSSERLKRNQPAVGAALVVTCISMRTKVEPFYLCFACLESFPQHFLEQHFDSRKHLVNTLMYQNPWRLPFAWDCDLDDDALRLMAWEEEEEMGNNEVLLKVFDMPHSIFWSLDCFDYRQVLTKLQPYYVLLKREVPPSETFSKLQQNEKFPLLGKQFLVNYDVIDNQEEPLMELGSLCLLCERKLSNDEASAHVFSREHVTTFLDCFHPGSLDSSSVSAETLLDLAKQAARIHTFSDTQDIKLNEPIWEPCDYRKAITILTAAKKRAGAGWLVPPITPKMKLIPRDTRKEVDQNQAEGSQKTSSDTDEQEKGKNKEEKSGENQMLMQREKELETEKEASPTTCSEEMQKADETVQATKVKAEKLTIEKPSREIATSFTNTGQDEGAQSVTKGSSSSKHVPAQLGDSPEKSPEKSPGKKRRSSSEKDRCPDEEEGIKRSPKRRRLSSKHDASCEASLKMPNGGGRKENVEKGEKTHKDVTTKVSSTLLECRCANRDPVYLCWSCSLVISEKEVVGHVARFNHQKMLQAAVNLDEKTYSKISKHSFQDAVHTLQALHLWPCNAEKPPSTSPPSHVKPLNASAALHDVSITVVDVKERDESENCAAAADTSAVTKAIAKTTQVPSGSNKDQSKTCMKVPKSAGSSHTSLIDPSRSKDAEKKLINEKKRSKDALRLNVPTCKANDLKSGVSPSKTVESMKIERTPKIEKMEAVSSICLATKSKSVTTSPKLTGSVSACSTTVSKTTSDAKSAAVSRPHGRGSGTASKVQVTSHKAAPSSQTGHTVAHEANYRTAASSKMNDVPRCAAIRALVAPQSKVPSVITAKKPETSVKHAKSDVSEAPHMKNSARASADVAANAPKRDLSAAPHLSTAAPERFERKTPHGELPRVSTDNRTASGNHFKVGSNHLTVVSCKGKQQVYCLLCSVRLNSSSCHHLISFNHQYNYVKLKYPEWTAKPLGAELKNKLNHTVALLAEVEQNLPHSRIVKKEEVKRDVYQKLGSLPEYEAVEAVKAMVRTRSSFSTTDSAEAMRLEGTSTCEVPSSDDGMLVPYNNIAEFSAYNQPQPENKSQRQTLLVQIPQMESNLKDEAHLVAAQLIRGQSLAGDETHACDLIQDQLQSCASFNQRISGHGIQVELIWGRKELRDSSSPKSHTVEKWQEVVSSSKVSSSDDGVCVPNNEVSAFSTSNQPDQERKKMYQTQFVQMTEMEPDSKREHILSAHQFPKVQSSGGEDARACDLIQDRLQSSRSVAKSHAEPVPAPCSQAEDKLENIKREPCEPDAETQPHSEAALVIESPAVKLEKAHGCTQRLINPNCRQQWKSDPPSQNQTKDRESTPKFSPVQSRGPQLQAAALNTGQENQSGPSHKAEQAPKQSPGPGEHRGSQMLTRTSIGGKTHEKSHLSFYLKASLQDTKPVIGMGSVWECRGMSLETFFLCESCEEILSRREICRHMVTHDHQLKYTWKEHPDYLRMFWFEEDLLLEMKMSILKDVVQLLSQRERVNEVDAQCILLEQELHGFVRTAPFYEALKILKNIKDGEKPSVFHVPISATQRKKAVNKAETSHSKETDLVGDLGVTFTFTKAEPVVSPVPAVGTHFNSPETCSGLSLQAEVKPAVSQLQRPDPLLQVKQEEVESTYVPTAGPAISQNLEVSPQNECPPTRKRRADMSVETLSRTLTSSSSLPAKYAPNPVQVKSEPSSPPISESPSVDPAVNSTLLHLKEEDDTEPKQNQPTEKWTLFADQSSALKRSDFKVNLSPSRSAPDNTETTNFWATDSSETVESRWQLKSVKTEIGALDSTCQLAKAMVNSSAPSISVEGIKKEAPVHLEYENQLFTTDENNTGHQISFYADPTASPTNTVAACGALGQYSQTACTTMRRSGHLSSQAVAGYTTPNNAQGSSQEYTPGELYPSQMYPEQTFSLPSSEHYVAAGIPPEWRNLEVQQRFYLWRRRWENGQ